MAERLYAVLLVVVCWLAVPMLVRGQGGTCFHMERCREDFQDQAKFAGQDRDRYCELQKQELQCFHNVISQCPQQQKSFAQKQIENAQTQQRAACHATSALPSSIAAVGGTVLALIIYRLL